jgi:hypothetical protein
VLNVRIEEELAIWALVEVLVLWILATFSLVTIFNQLPANILDGLLFSLFALSFLPATALALSIRRFRIERKEKEE